MLSSLDDFYLMKETSLSVVQTTNGIYNTSLYDDVSPEALPAWMRVRLANALATSGELWAKYLKRYNGGTYNNQYLIIDAKRFEPGQVIQCYTFYMYYVLIYIHRFKKEKKRKKQTNFII